VRKINGCQGVFGKEKTFGNKLILTTGKEKRIKPCAVLVSLVHHFYSAIKTVYHHLLNFFLPPTGHIPVSGPS